MRFVPSLKPLASILFVSAAALGAAEPLTPPAQRVSEHFSEAVKYYYLGEYNKASIALRTGLKLDPTDRLCFDFYNEIGIKKFMDMVEREELRDTMQDVLRRARIYERALRRSPTFIEHLIGRLVETEDKRLVATNELVTIGPIAVPHVLKQLVGGIRNDDMRSACRVVLSHMGHRAVLPLVAILKTSDISLVQASISSLSDIADKRAIPALSALRDAKTTDAVTKKLCENALERIKVNNQLGELPSGAAIFLKEADRYWNDDQSVSDEGQTNEYLIWRSDTGEMPVKGTTVARYAWNELMAQQLVLDGIAAYGQHEVFQPLLTCIIQSQWTEAQHLLALAKDRKNPSEYADELPASIQKRIAALAGADADRPELEDRVIAMGPANIYKAITRAIVSEHRDVAVRLMQHLQDPRLAQAEALLPSREEGVQSGKEGTALVSALDVPDRVIRYQAAITLTQLDPALRFFNAEKVVPVLTEAVGEWGMRVVLVVEPDYRERNAARQALLEKGYLPITAANGHEALQRLNETPVKDCIVIAGDLVPTLFDEHKQVINVPEQTSAGLIEVLSTRVDTKSIPLVLSLPEKPELAVDIQNKLGPKVKDCVKRPYNSTELSIKLDKILSAIEMSDSNRQEREAISLAAAESVRKLSPTTTQYAVEKLGEALASNIVKRSDRIRASNLEALGHIGRKDLMPKVLDAWQETKQENASKPLVRAAFMSCIGKLDPQEPAAIAALTEGVNDSDREVRRQAFAGLGHGTKVPAPALQNIQNKRLIEILAAGNGLDAEPAAPTPAPAKTE